MKIPTHRSAIFFREHMPHLSLDHFDVSELAIHNVAVAMRPPDGSLAKDMHIGILFLI